MAALRDSFKPPPQMFPMLVSEPGVHLQILSLVSSSTILWHVTPYYQEIFSPDPSALCSLSPGLPLSPAKAPSSVLLNQTAGSALQVAQGWQQRLLGYMHGLKASRGGNEGDWEFPNPSG